MKLPNGIISHELSCSTPKKSTVDCVVALRFLTERMCDFRTGLLSAYVDLGKAFDSVNRENWPSVK